MEGSKGKEVKDVKERRKQGGKETKGRTKGSSGRKEIKDEGSKGRKCTCKK